MKRIIGIALTGLLLLCSACAQGGPPAATEPPPESRATGLTVSFDFEKQKGTASNQYAVWIEDMDGNLVKTLDATAYTAKGGYKARPDSLSTWVSKAMGVSDFDTVASATPESCNVGAWWDLADEAGQAVPPGAYKFFVEGTLRWKNSVLYSGEIEIGDNSTIVQGEPQFVFEGEGKQPALDENAPECGMITNVQAGYTA